jgi:hypothetical protein
MDHCELDLIVNEYAERVIHWLQSWEFLSAFPECSQILIERIQKIPAWQLALPVISCLATGGTLEAGQVMTAAWYPGYLASEILDNVEDKEFIPDRFLPSPEIATNLATGLIFIAFRALTLILDPERAYQAARIFSESGFQATFGQHRDLMKAPASVEDALDEYWEVIILKSGSVFRTATAGGAAAGTSDERYIDALGDYGTALGVMLQLIDDCRDVFTRTQEKVNWEITLPLLLYLMRVGEDHIDYPEVATKAEWSDMLKGIGVITAISSILLEWKTCALKSLEPLEDSLEKHLLETIPSIFLERIPLSTKEVLDGEPS